MGYRLGVDLGTTFTAVAVSQDGRAVLGELGDRGTELPSVVFLREDGAFAVGEAAERRGAVAPERLAREFKRRVGDPTPLLLGGTPFSAHALTAVLLREVVARVSARQGGPPDALTVTHPANWGAYKQQLLREAVDLAAVPPTTLLAEPEAAARRYGQLRRLADGDVVAVYDLGGGTFDAAVLTRTRDGFQVLGTPAGIEQLGGVDFDDAVFHHVLAALGDRVAELDPEDPATAAALIRLRRDCVGAKEALSQDDETAVPVGLPGLHTSVRVTRSELEDLIRPPMLETVTSLRRALRSAEVDPEDLTAVLLAGGSSRIPLVAELLSAQLGRPIAVDAHPKHLVALGAATADGPVDRVVRPAPPLAPPSPPATAPAPAPAPPAPTPPASPPPHPPLPAPQAAPPPAPAEVPSARVPDAAEASPRARPTPDSRRRRTRLAAGLAVAVLALTGAAVAVLARDATPARLTFWLLEGANEAAVRTSIERWSEGRDGPPARVEVFPNAVYAQQLARGLGRDGPTVWQSWGGGALQSHVDAARAADLTDVVDGRSGDLFLPGTLEPVTFDGRVYGQPMSETQPVVLFYDRRTFEAIDAQPPATWAQLLALVPRLRAAGVTPLALAGADPWTFVMWEEYLVQRIGGRPVVEALVEGRPGAWSAPAVLQAHEMIRRLVELSAFAPDFASVSEDSGQGTALLRDGQAAMHLMGTWAYASAASDPGFRDALGYVAFPAVEGGAGDPRDVVGNVANYFSVSTGASQEHRDAATDYLEQHVMAPAYVDALLATGSLPPVLGLEERIADSPHRAWLAFQHDLVRNAPHYQLSWDQALAPPVADALLEQLPRLFHGEITPQALSAVMDAAAG